MLPLDDRGSGAAVVLLHAGVADRRMWAEHLDPIAEAGYRAIAVDLPAFGEAPPAERGEWELALETIDGLSLERAALVGNSFGGAVAMRVAALAPTRISALALISSPPLDLDPSLELKAVWQAEGAALEAGDIEAAVDVILDAWTLPDAPPELRDRVARMQRRAFEVQATASGEEPPDPLEERPELLSELAVPALVAAGEHEFSDFREGAEAIASAIPGARLELIEGAGHLAPLEQPEAFGALLLAFLDQTAGRTSS
jgi:pimeloyl-ACP methyl ester carboxylesterase